MNIGQWTWNFFLRQEPFNGTDSLYITAPINRHQRMVAKVTMEMLDFTLPVDGPSLECSREQREDNLDPIHGMLQGALDFAWAQGMRPTGWNPPADATAELTATRYHLEDMRALAKVPARQKDQP